MSQSLTCLDAQDVSEVDLEYKWPFDITFTFRDSKGELLFSCSSPKNCANSATLSFSDAGGAECLAARISERTDVVELLVQDRSAGLARTTFMCNRVVVDECCRELGFVKRSIWNKRHVLRPKDGTEIVLRYARKSKGMIKYLCHRGPSPLGNVDFRLYAVWAADLWGARALSSSGVFR